MHRFRVALNLPNQLTLGRLGLCVFFVAAMSFDFPYSRTLALAIFVVASLTDWLDGALARRYGLITDLGKLLDPLADKILISAAFIGLMGDQVGAPMWVVVTIIAREFLITGLRIVAANQGFIMAAERAGKHKTVSQMAFVTVALILESADELGIGESHFLSLLDFVQPLLLWITLGITVGSGAIYFYKNRGLFADAAETEESSRPAFKEWRSVVAALAKGEQAVILRKGGIAEGKSGFQPVHERFWLLPTRFHEEEGKLKPGAVLPPEHAADEAPVTLSAWAEVAEVRYLTRWEEVEALAPFHHWTTEAMRERFDWKEPGLHCFVLRVYRLDEPVTVPWQKNFGGCRSWTEAPADWAGRPSVPAMDEAAFAALRQRVNGAVATPVS
ncbi:MAG: CDP-diacylglycerol--glycerol-3-phosphate 3-phosphatidyltransferase [Verrucomicrobium sp.]|nr:CDP-diacylglycerol--glycerol-3-phosphate 3-phosphatidyltransferase [Verrucomicrobium sp.]